MLEANDSERDILISNKHTPKKRKYHERKNFPAGNWTRVTRVTGGYTDRYTNAELDIRGGNYYKYNVLITCTNDWFAFAFCYVKSSFKTKYVNHIEHECLFINFWSNLKQWIWKCWIKNLIYTIYRYPMIFQMNMINMYSLNKVWSMKYI